MSKKFNIKLKVTHIPYPLVHNIIRGTDHDKPNFYIKVFLYNLLEVNKQMSLKKAATFSLNEVINNTAIATKAIYNRFNDKYSDDSLCFRELKNGEKVIQVYPPDLEKELYKFKWTIVDIARKNNRKIDDAKYKDQAIKYFKGRIHLSGDFQKIMWEKSVTNKELRVLLCLMRKVVNQNKKPAISVDYFEKFTGMKPFLIRKIITQLVNKNLVVCEDIESLKGNNLVIMFVSSTLDSGQEKDIEDFYDDEPIDLSKIKEIDELGYELSDKYGDVIHNFL